LSTSKRQQGRSIAASSSARLLALPLRYKPWRARHARLILRDVFARRSDASRGDLAHLHAAIDWLCRAQDVRDGKSDAGGVSAGWSFEDGWLPSYPETSGYIVETFIAAAKILERPKLIARAHRIIDWELSLQHADGAFPGHFGEPGKEPVIFNTGQIMHGMLAGYLQLGRPECIESAVRAGYWLARHQNAEGCWDLFEHHGVRHTYNTRATWALLATGLLASDTRLKDAAVRHLQWALAQQRPSGWFANNAFMRGREPFTHTIAYAIRGFLECGVLLDDRRYVGAAEKAARALAAVQRENGGLAATFDENWIGRANYCCITGVAQMSLNWTRIAQETGAAELRDHARRAIEYVKGRQRPFDRDPIVRGAIAGSAPIWGRYSMFEFPNWAAKFFADAVMMDLTNVAVPPVATQSHRSCGEAATLAAAGSDHA
jgi:squalene-hopene cyclase-like protein